MKPEQLEKWKTTRQKGMWRYVLVSGVLSYGLTMFIPMTFFVNRDHLSAQFIARSAVLWSLSGAAFGLLTWWLQDRQFRKAVSDGAA